MQDIKVLQYTLYLLGSYQIIYNMEFIPVHNAKQNHSSQMLVRTLDANVTGSLVGKSFGIGERFQIQQGYLLSCVCP